MLEHRAVQALRRPANWIQLAKFGVVGASGYVVNLGVYTLLLRQAHLHYLVAASSRSSSPPSWNYWWNRHWTFRAQRGHFGYQGMRFFAVSGLVYLANLGVLGAARLGRRRQDHRAGDRDRGRDAAELPREQALVVSSLRTRSLSRSSRPAPSSLPPSRRRRSRRPPVSRSALHRSASRPRPPPAGTAADERGGREDLPGRRRRCTAGSSATRRSPTIDATYSNGHLDGRRLLGQGGRDRDGNGRRRHRRGARRPGHGPPGRLGDGPRRPRRLRRHEDQLLLGLARLLCASS